MTEDRKIRDIELGLRNFCWGTERTHDELWKAFSSKCGIVDMNTAIQNCINNGTMRRVSPGIFTTVFENGYEKPGQEVKADAGKPELSYLLEFPKALAGMSRVSEYGARKYGRNTWRRVEKQRYIDALLRHTIAIGPNALAKDNESKLFHVWQVMWNAAAIAELIEEEMQCTSN